MPLSRRELLGATAGLTAGFAAAPSRFDILIRNGDVRDPGRGVSRRADVAIADGKIAAVEASIPGDQAREIIDARGLYVTPGLVDLHTHCYHGATGLSIEADPIAARTGVTTWVDAGSFGADQAGGFRRFIVAPQQARVFGYIHLYPNLRNPDVDPVQYAKESVALTGKTAVAMRDVILGLKVYVGSNMNGRYSLDFLKIGRALCDQFKIPMMVHISFAPPETPVVMELMRPGDVVTHCYNTHTLGILDQAGKLKPGVKEARARGVLFDVGHGVGSFNFDIARKALDAGFPPDTISTDLYNLNTNGPVYDMPTTLSKFLHLGMSFEEVLRLATAAPARVINRLPGMGSLEVGAPADVALLAIEEGQFRLVDSQRNAVTASRRIVSRLTICRGRRMAPPVPSSGPERASGTSPRRRPATL